MCDISFVNSAHIINQNPRVTAINSCIEVDLTGQVCADSIGTRLYSGMSLYVSVCLSVYCSHCSQAISTCLWSGCSQGRLSVTLSFVSMWLSQLASSHCNHITRLSGCPYSKIHVHNYPTQTGSRIKMPKFQHLQQWVRVCWTLNGLLRYAVASRGKRHECTHEREREWVVDCLSAGVGGQIDFMRGAALGLDGLGKPILAMPSATKKGESKIVPVLKPGQ